MDSVITTIHQCIQRDERPLSVIDLIEKELLTLHQTAWLVSRVEEGSSWLVGAIPGHAGKTTLMSALLVFVEAQEQATLAPVGSSWESFGRNCCVVAEEISDHRRDRYLWERENLTPTAVFSLRVMNFLKYRSKPLSWWLQTPLYAARMVRDKFDLRGLWRWRLRGRPALPPHPYQITYSQCGEDLMVKSIFEMMGKSTFAYLDVGAYDPVHLSNTYLHYQAGCRGVCVEPDSARCALIQQKRPGDNCLNAGMGATEETRDFYVMCPPTLSTFSKAEAESSALMEGNKIKRVEKLQLFSFERVMNENFSQTPEFVSLDIEGGELEVLRSIDFQKHRPLVWCIETLNFASLEHQGKRNDILRFMLQNGYAIYADTWINTLFVDKKNWPVKETLADL